MEYNIYNESLVYYALRDKEGNYYRKDLATGKGHLISCTILSTKEDIESVKLIHPEFNEVRKIKIIDIGGLDD